MTKTSAQSQLTGVAARLHDDYAGMYSPETVDAVLSDSYEQLAARAKITTFLPVLAERWARERLSASARADGLITSAIPEVLFVCIHNAGRSQMAAGLLRYRGEGRINVRSAGSEPADRVNPAVFQAMDEIGIDLSEAFPKPLTDEAVRAADVVVTMGCGDVCPVYPGKVYEDWQLEDPSGKDLAAVRAIRDRVDEHVQALVGRLQATA
jgi:arsenate reductase